MSLLEVKKINKFFGKKHVIKDVSFKIDEGEILGFIGPNGAGKTTTIKVILGLQSLNSGEVLINGYSISKDFEKAILKVGAIVESPDLYMYLSGRKNLEMIGAMYKGVSKERIDEIIKMVGLEKRIDDKVSKYSLGMRQRLGIAAALIHKPNLLILDEPTNGLDPEGIKELRDLLKKLAKTEKMGILISSHNLLELESFVTDVCLIKNGEVVVTSSIKDMRRGDRTVYIIRLDKTDGIQELLNKGDEVLDNKFIKIYRDEKDIPEFIELLVKKKYKIYEVRENIMTLEEAFLKKAGGNIID